jgi:hypothetical protein
VFSIHVCLALSRLGVWENPWFGRCVDEFVKLFPQTDAESEPKGKCLTFEEVAVVYLCFANAEDMLIQYLSELDCTEVSMRLEKLVSVLNRAPRSENDVMERADGVVQPDWVVANLVQGGTDGALSLRVLVLMKMYDLAFQLIPEFEISMLSPLDMFDILKTCRFLYSKMLPTGSDAELREANGATWQKLAGIAERNLTQWNIATAQAVVRDIRAVRPYFPKPG